MGNSLSCVRGDTSCVSTCFRGEPYKLSDVVTAQAAPPEKHLDVVAGKRPVPGNKAVINSEGVDADLIQNVLDHENGPASGLPYQVHYLGPPAPPCEADRAATMRALDKIKETAEDDPEIASILRLTTNMFQAPVALVALFDTKRVYVSGSQGGVIPCGDFPWRWTLCAWSLAYNNAQILVIPDTLQDCRFRENAKVTGYPGVRFYCGAPLIASNGHRLGTLCFADVAPRPGFDAASCSVMNNLSELVVRHLEKDIALKLKTRDNDVLKATYGQLQRTLDCFEHCVVLVDTGVEGWALLHANSAWAKLTGVERSDVVGKPLREVFEGAEGLSLPTPELQQAATKCYDFQVSAARLRVPSPLGNPKGGFLLTFRPASREGMDDSVVPIGIPAFLRPTAEGAADAAGNASPGARRFYFMSVDLSGRAAASKSSVLSGVSSTWSAGGSDVVEGLELGHLLGKGSFGSVYYGTWMGAAVAVKVLDTDVRRAFGSGSPLGAAPEALLGQQLRHPNVVATLKWVARKVDRPNHHTSIMCSMDASDGPTGKGKVKALPASEGHTRPAEADIPEGSEQGTSDEGTGTGGAVNYWPVINFAEAKLTDEGEGEASGAHTASGMGVGASATHSMDWPALPPSGGHTNLGKATVSDSRGEHFSTDGNAFVQTWILMEYCDRGCLQEAIDRGWLRTERSALSGGPSLPAVLSTAREVAAAMAYLHSANIVHGDLSGWNVMLASAGAAAGVGGRGFVAKVADFGLSRTLEMRSKMQTATYGTLSHMPPELVLNGTMCKAVDVYSFGVLLWQMYTGSRPWAGLTHSQIIMLISSGEAQLKFPSGTPPGFEALMRACMQRDPDARPAFTDVVKALDMLFNELCGEGSF